MRNGGPAASNQTRLGPLIHGSKNTAAFGKNGSTGSMNISRDFKARTNAVAERNNIDLLSDPLSIIGSRVFDAPRELVFEVWTDPKHLSQWWGPNGFTTTTK